MIRIMVDSAADYLKEQLAEKNIAMAPLTITVNEEKSYLDELELSRGDLYELLIKGGSTVKTSQPSPDAFLRVFKEAKAAGDELICITVSSALSGTYRSAMLARDMADYDKIYVVDSLSATAGIRIMADQALKLVNDGWNAKDIVSVMHALKGKIRITAVVDTLKYLYLGGRVSRTTAVVADTVNIKPGIVVTREGTVGVSGKYLGVNRAVKDLVRMAANAEIDTNYPIYIVYSHNEANSGKLVAALEEAGIRVDGICEIGATLGVHVGPGAFGVIYIAK